MPKSCILNREAAEGGTRNRLYSTGHLKEDVALANLRLADVKQLFCCLRRNLAVT